MSSLKRVQQWATFARIWHVYDAKWQNPLESAKMLNKYLMGTYKPIYHPMNNCGDHVVIINSQQIALPGEEWIKRVYFHHTGYPGGASWTLAHDMHRKDPTLIIKKAIYGSMEGNLQRRHTMARLHIYPDANLPEDIKKNISNQIRQLRPVPKRLDHYDAKEVEAFPKIMEYPKDYVLR